MHVYTSEPDFPHFIPHDSHISWPNSSSQEHSLPHNQTQDSDLSHNRPLVLPWPEQLQAAQQVQALDPSLADSHLAQPPLFPGTASPTEQWSNDSLHWQQLLCYQYPFQDELETYPNDQSTLPHLPLLTNLTVPAPYSLSDSTSAPQSATYSSGSPFSYGPEPHSPFSFPPSPLTIDPAATTQFPEGGQRYVHPSDLTAPLQNATAPPSLSDWNKNATTNHAHLTDRPPSSIQDTHIDVAQLISSKTHLPAPTTRSRTTNRFIPRSPHSGSTSDARTTDRVPSTTARPTRRTSGRYRGEKRKRTQSDESLPNPPKQTRAKQNRSSNRQTRSRKPPSASDRTASDNGQSPADDLANEAKKKKAQKREQADDKAEQVNGYNDDLEDSADDEDDEDEDDEYDDDDSYSVSRADSSFSPSSSPPPLPSDTKSENTVYTATTNGTLKEPRTRRKAIGSLPLPVPVPNLTKKSRGRKVPIIAGTSESSQPDRPLGQRVYMCRVPDCGKCFVRGEHLKRHVRSIHTHEKPYPCLYEGCDKSFSRRDNLAQHSRVHRDRVR